MALLDKSAVSYQAVLTKTDKLTAPVLEARLAEVAAELAKHPAAHPDIIATSSRKRDGIDDLRRVLAALANERETG
jgi:GTP-binding protein